MRSSPVRHHLRKGQSSVYLCYGSSVGDTIGAKRFQVAAKGSTAVIQFQLAPVDGNQGSDASRLHSEELTEVHLSDDQVIENLDRFLRHSYVNVDEVRLRIMWESSSFGYLVSFGEARAGHLPLLVRHDAA